MRAKSSSSSSKKSRLLPVWLGLAVVALLALPALAGAHLERPSYWPDPAVDKSVKGGAGGEVPKARSLASAITGAGPGEVRVVCQGRKGAGSLKAAFRSIGGAKKNGFRLRPSIPATKLSAKRAKGLRKMNVALAKMCRYHSVQKAITASGNNDRVVIMPGRYVERASRKSPVNDPRCNPSLLQGDQSGTPTPSYEYQVKCPNDQNLIHLAGRAVIGDPLPQPRADRHGIPESELGRCIRCNVQIDGSGAKPEDVVLDAGTGYTNPRDPKARPGGDTPSSECFTDDTGNPCFGKHVVLRVDRGDGFVGRNFTMRGAREHGFYTEETDGILLDKVKFFWNADYGHLSFTTDHHIVQNCDGFGSGDAVVYPGAAPQTGEFRKKSFYPERRFSTIIRRCDLHGSAMGYSGSMGNSVRVTNNHFYGNANGLTTDTLSAPGHPGFPADGMMIDNNWFYANNLDVYRAENPFQALVPQPVGTGFFWAGNNDGDFVDNYVFDNWRHGTMLISVPDAIAGEADGAVDSGIHCPTSASGPFGFASTSCYNRFSGNKMGQVPPGFKPHPELTLFGNQTNLAEGITKAPNGVDFWWDEQPVNLGNCWTQNTGPDGTRASLNPDPPLAPAAGQNLPTFLPEGCTEVPADPSSVANHAPGTSMGDSVSYAEKAPILLACFGQWETKQLDAPACSWYNTPPRPATPASRKAQNAERAAGERWLDTAAGQKLKEWVREFAGSISLGPSNQ